MARIPVNSIALPAIIDLDAIDAVRDRLLDAIDTGDTAVSGAEVERVSTNALFMLLSAAETARRNNFTFAVTGASAPLETAIDRLGLRPSFAGILEG